MSVHRSLKLKAGLSRSRNVWTRAERLESLKKVGKLKDGESVFGLPKVRTTFKQKKVK
jgi:small basic protein (TIGR04137 family)